MPRTAEVRSRVFRSAYLLGHTLKVVRAWREEATRDGWTPGAIAATFTDPMPVLQGWEPSDYAESAAWCGGVFEGFGMDWPGLVGVGSVCRRALRGANGLTALLSRLDRELPPHVRLHLFGVKGPALAELAAVSADSAAWDFRARKVAREAGTSNTTDNRVAHMVAWHARQAVSAPDPQIRLL